MMIVDGPFKFITNEGKGTTTITGDFAGAPQSIEMPNEAVEKFFAFMSGVAFMQQIMSGNVHTNQALAAELERQAAKK